MPKPLRRNIRLSRALPDDWVASLKETYPDHHLFNTTFSCESVDVRRPDGRLSFVFRHQHPALQGSQREWAYRALFALGSKVSNNRGAAAGPSGSMRSGTGGYLDPRQRAPYCRTTAFTAEEVNKWRTTLPFIRAVADVYRREAPDQYAAQMAMVEQTNRYWVIADTPFTTITVNRTWQTALHQDDGDLPSGFGVLTVLSEGDYSGGLLVFPKYRIAFDVREGDVLLADMSEFHGNSPFIGTAGEFERVAVILYYRTNMVDCGTPAAEYRLADSQQPAE